MRIYIKLVSVVLALVFVLSAVSLIGASAEDFAYTQPEKFIYGDVDLDGTVTVKDATLIQKGLANITYVTAVQRYLADPESTGYSIKNATAIQKYLAKYEATTLWNTELSMATSDQFSSKVSISSDIALDYIIVRVKNSYNEVYTLKDFLEYNFSKVIQCEYNSSRYYLYLEEPGKENIIEALKSLDYRANIDLVNASANSMGSQD